MDTTKQLENFCTGYANRLSDVLGSSDWSGVAQLGRDMCECWTAGRQVFICGNGGSAGNAIHLLKNLPDWYLYGSNALLERVQILKNRESDIPYIPELVKIDNEKIKLESLIIDITGANSMQLSRVSIAPKIPIKPNKRIIVLLAFFGSFMMSIFLALVMGALKPDEENST